MYTSVSLSVCFMCACVYVSVCLCVCVCVHACVHACVRAAELRLQMQNMLELRSSEPDAGREDQKELQRLVIWVVVVYAFAHLAHY